MRELAAGLEIIERALDRTAREVQVTRDAPDAGAAAALSVGAVAEIHIDRADAVWQLCVCVDPAK